MISMEELKNDAAEMTGWERHRFFALIVGVILISTFLVSVSMSLYNSSGAAQVDLSRPGYQSIQKEASREATSAQDAFPSTGKLDAAAFDSFNKSYNNHADRVVNATNFDAEALRTDTLQVFSVQDQAVAQ